MRTASQQFRRYMPTLQVSRAHTVWLARLYDIAFSAATGTNGVAVLSMIACSNDEHVVALRRTAASR
jgi:hypothetical protein